MITSLKFRRCGAFLIDSSVGSMLFQIALMLPFIQSLRLSFDFSKDLLLILSFLILYVFVYMLYSTICFYLLKNSLGKLLLRIKIVDSKKKDFTVGQLISREYAKITYLIATLVIGYVLYGIYQYVLSNKKVLHETRPSESSVVNN